MANPENLKRPLPGEVRNPNGRPKGRLSTKTILKKFLPIIQDKKNVVSGEIEGISIHEQMILAMINKVIKKGDVQAFKELTDRLEGKAKESIDVKSTGTVDLMYDIGGSLIKITNEAKKNEQEES